MFNFKISYYYPVRANYFFFADGDNYLTTVLSSLTFNRQKLFELSKILLRHIN